MLRTEARVSEGWARHTGEGAGEAGRRYLSIFSWEHLELVTMITL